MALGGAGKELNLFDLILEGNIGSVKRYLQQKRKESFLHKALSQVNSKGQTPAQYAGILHTEAIKEENEVNLAKTQPIFVLLANCTDIVVNSQAIFTAPHSYLNALLADSPIEFNEEVGVFPYFDQENFLELLKHAYEYGNLTSNILELKNAEGDSLLLYAAKKKSADILEFLLTLEEIDLWQRDNSGKSMVDILGHMEVERGENPKLQKIYDELTPDSITYAAALGEYSYIDFFITKSCPIHSPDRLGDTPLHAAARAGQAEMIPWLVEQGATLELKNKAVLTPMDALFAEFFAYNFFLKDEEKRNTYINTVIALITAGATLNTSFGYLAAAGELILTSPYVYLRVLSESDDPLKLDITNRIIFAALFKQFPKMASVTLKTDLMELNAQLWAFVKAPGLIETNEISKPSALTIPTPRGAGGESLMSPDASKGRTAHPHRQAVTPFAKALLSPRPKAEALVVTTTTSA